MLEQRALVVGASGLVGRALMRQLRARGIDCLGTYANHPVEGLSKLDITSFEQVRDCLARIRPSRIFLTAALTHVDYCEDHREEAFRINVEGPRVLAREARKLGAKVIFYSTEYVFDGKAGPYDEDAPPAPLSIYGQTKLEAEVLVRENTEDALILRTTVVYGWEPASSNFAMQVLQRVRGGEKMTIPDDQIGNPTLAEYLAETSIGLAEMGVTGVVNVVGKDLVPRSAFARALVETFDGDPYLVVPVSTESLKQRAPRPLRGGLCTEKLARITGSQPISLSEALQRLRREYKESIHEMVKLRKDSEPKG